MKILQEIFSNREFAFGFWIIIIIAILLIDKHHRPPFLRFIKALFGRHLLKAYLLLIIYLSLVFYIVSLINVWDFSYSKDAILWVFTVAFYLIFKSQKITNIRYFINLILDGIKLSAILEFIVNLGSSNLIVELILALVIITLTAVHYLTSRNIEQKKVSIFSKNLLNIFTIIIYVYSITIAITLHKDWFKVDSLENYFFPVILTILYLPFLYSLALYNSYTKCFNILNGVTSQKTKVKIVKKIIKRIANINLYRISNITKRFDIRKLHKDIDLAEYVKDIAISDNM